jgi:hypothetical protein
VARAYRKLLLGGAAEKVVERVGRGGAPERKVVRKGPGKEALAAAGAEDGGLPLGAMLRCRIRYFTDGAVIGSRGFVNEAFASARERFGPRRRDGARKLRGAAAPAAGSLWSLRDLRAGV